MSTRNNKQQFITKKPYCKVCHDAGKSENEYTNHYVRSSPDRNGNTNVICPTLLSTECRFCYKLGHTTKFCPVIATRKKYEEKSARLNQIKLREQEKKEKENKNEKKNMTGFSALYIDSDSEDETNKPNKQLKNNKKQVVDEFPQLCSVKTDKHVMMGYAEMVLKPVSAKVVAETVSKKVVIVEPITKKVLRETVLLPIKKEFHPHPIKKSWADYSDSSEGEDEDEEDIQYNFDNNDHDDCDEFPSFINNEPTYYQDCI